MRGVGFSTGALAKGDFAKGVSLQNARPELRAIELSALREHELPQLALGFRNLDLTRATYISIHAPSKLREFSEHRVLELLSDLPAKWPIIVHPEIVETPELWRTLGSRLCLENMDNRKPNGRTLEEVRQLLSEFPEASFCLDLGHARQIDPTMATAMRMALEFGDRLRQIHVSEVGLRGEHLPLGALAIYAFQLVAPLLPAECPVIIESVVPEAAIESEIRKILALFGREGGSNWSLEEAAALAS
ncbi:MAG: hypothetical protein WBX15_18765 [Thermoanaerobaculia bacterium]